MAMTDRADEVRHIDFARDFSPYLGPRYERFGPHSGELFLRSVLLPAWEAEGSPRIVVDLDSYTTSGASFFDEAFGTLVTRFGLDKVLSRVEFHAIKRAYLVPRILGWMREAEARRVEGKT